MDIVGVVTDLGMGHLPWLGGKRAPNKSPYKSEAKGECQNKVPVGAKLRVRGI